MPHSRTTQRLAGLAGLAGALLFFCGDMLFYGHFGAGVTFHQGMERVVREASLARLFTGGLLGPPAACLCIIGFWHVGQKHRATKSATRSRRLLHTRRHDGRGQCSSRVMGAAWTSITV
jgi:hypothetical protein